MVDFSQIRKELLKAEPSEEGDDSEDESSILAGMATIVPGWKRELDDFYTAAPSINRCRSFICFKVSMQ